MNIREFLYKNTSITYIVLASYLLMSIGQSYAMQWGVDIELGSDGISPSPLSIGLMQNEISPSYTLDKSAEIDFCEFKNDMKFNIVIPSRARFNSDGTEIGTSPFAATYSPCDEERRLSMISGSNAAKGKSIVNSDTEVLILPEKMPPNLSPPILNEITRFNINNLKSGSKSKLKTQELILYSHREGLQSLSTDTVDGEAPHTLHPGLQALSNDTLDGNGKEEVAVIPANNSSCPRARTNKVDVSAEFSDIEAAADAKIENKTLSEETNKKDLTYKNKIPYAKSSVSFSVSLIASAGLAFFAYYLALPSDEVIAYILFAVALLSNSILYHKNNMALSLDDLKVGCSDSLCLVGKEFCSVLLKFSVALISSIPLAFVTFKVNLSVWSGLAYASCVASLACTIPLFYKAQTSLVDYVKYIFSLINEENESKKARGWDMHNALEELSALDRDEVYHLYEVLNKLKSESLGGGVPNDGFTEFISLMLPKELDTLNRFYCKECSAAAFGIFSAVFGGMYLFLVSDSIYETFLQESSQLNGLELFTKNSKEVALAAAIAVLIGQNSLQANAAYSVSKNYALKFIRSYEKRIGGRHVLLSTKRNIDQFQKNQEYVFDVFKVILAGGSAIARAALALQYIKNPALLACVLVGTDISYFTTFIWGMKYIESETEIEKKRGKILSFLNTCRQRYVGGWSALT